MVTSYVTLGNPFGDQPDDKLGNPFVDLLDDTLGKPFGDQLDDTFGDQSDDLQLCIENKQWLMFYNNKCKLVGCRING